MALHNPTKQMIGQDIREKGTRGGANRPNRKGKVSTGKPSMLRRMMQPKPKS